MLHPELLSAYGVDESIFAISETSFIGLVNTYGCSLPALVT